METAPRLPQSPAAPPRPYRRWLRNTGQLRPGAGGRHALRDRRLLALYFDLSAMPPGDQIRAYQAALPLYRIADDAADLVALVTYEGGAVRIKQDFTANKAQTPRNHRHPDLR